MSEAAHRTAVNAMGLAALLDATGPGESPLPIDVAGYLGHLAPRQIEFVLERELLGEGFEAAFRRSPERAGDLVDLLEAHPALRELPAARRYFLVRSFNELEKPLLDLVLAWLADLAENEGVDWAQGGRFAEEVLFYMPSFGGEFRKYQRFAIEHFAIVRAIGRAAVDAKKRSKRTTLDFVDHFSERASVLKVAWCWTLGGHEGAELLAKELLADLSPEELSDLRLKTDPELRLASHLASGDKKRLRALLSRKALSWEEGQAALAGWAGLEPYPELHRFLSEAVSRKERIPSVFRLLSTIALVLRLRPRLRFTKRLASLEAASKDGDPLERLVRLRRLAGKENLPGAVVEVAERKEALVEELRGLRAIPIERLTRFQLERIEKIAAQLDDEPSLRDWIARDLSKVLPRHLDAAKLEALTILVDETVQEHWRSVMGRVPEDAGHPDWMNALHLLLTARSNRRILKETFRRGIEAMRAHPKNRAFLESARAKGADTDAWRARHSLDLSVRRRALEAYTEDQPLRILQMGNIFGTCLSAGSVNAFSCVANAVEVNKRVLYVRDADDKILARKLIVLFPSLVVAGYRTYGTELTWDEPAADRPWFKIALDLLCLEIATRSKVRLHAEGVEPEGPPELFARWYDDGTEPFDTWIVSATSSPPSKQAVLERVRPGLTEAGHSARGEWLRALLWLGDEAIPLLEDTTMRDLITLPGFDFLRIHTERSEVKRIVTEVCRARAARSPR